VWPFVVAAALVLSTSAAVAQVTTAGIRGAVRADDGATIEIAQVTLIHGPTGNRKVAYSNEGGEFAFTGLRVGGPYALRVEFEGYFPRELEDIYLSVGKTERIDVVLRLAEVEGETIEVETKEPGTSSKRVVFSEEDIDNLPSIGRDPKDIARLSPDTYVDGTALSIGGNNNRFNSVTVDGIRQDDDFGLNASGYATQRSPIALLSVEEIAIERSPFDVRYSRFLGGNINIVTKSGTNDFHGTVLWTFANQALAGSTLDGEDIDRADFREVRYGLNLGGPIVKDKVHFFLSVEGLNAATPTSVGPVGSSAANQIGGVTARDVERVQDISRDVYGFQAGVPSQSLDEVDIKLLAKIDWTISDRHRLTGKYQRTAGNVIKDSPAFFGNLPLTSNWYDQRDALHAFTLQINSNWTSKLASRFELAGKIVDSKPTPLNGNDFMQAEISTPDGGTIVVGPDVFRHANALDNNLLHGKAEADYLLGKHLLLAGAEYDYLDLFNLFSPYSRGAAEYASIEDFENLQPTSIFYQNAISNDANDAAANWSYGIVSTYLQDQYSLTPDLTVQGGLRFEIYHASDDIAVNQSFVDRYGFSNAETVNGRSVLMPRLGATYRPIKGLNVRGGAGLYSGGAPNVWISNSYTNDGVSVDSVFSNDTAVISGFDGRNLPSEITSQLTPGDGNVDAIDPDFQVPSSWKLSTGVDYSAVLPVLGRAGIELDYTFTKVKDGIRWVDLRRDLGALDANQPVGLLPDGRPYYDFDDSDGTVFDTRRGYDMLLSNTDKGRGHTASVTVKKPLPFGFYLYGGYSYQNVTEVSPATSSRSVSNYGLAAVSDPNDPEASRSNYERRHRLVGAIQFRRALLADLVGSQGVWRGLDTSLGLFLEARSGQPFSYTFGDSAGGDDLARLFGEEREFARRNRQLFYVPNGGDDVILDGIEPNEFVDFLRRSGLAKYRGQIVPRNAFTSQWYKRIDLRFAQEVPGVLPNQKGKVFVDIQNLGNLLNSKWGEEQSVPFPFTVPVVDVAVDPASGRYVYSNLRTQDPERVNVLTSLWRIQLNFMLQF